MTNDDVAFRLVAERRVFERLCDHLGALVQEARLHVTPSGIWAAPVDPANIAMIRVDIGEEGFAEFDAPAAGDEVPFTIGLAIDQFSDFIGEAGREEFVEMTFDEQTQMITLRLPAENREAEISMGAIDPEMIRKDQDPEEKDMESGLKGELYLDAGALEHGLDLADMVADHTRFDVDPERESPFHLTAEGDTDDVTIRYDSALGDGSSVDGVAQSLFSLDYLQEALSPPDTGTEVRLRIGDEWPCRIEWSFLDGEGEADVMIAPRVET